MNMKTMNSGWVSYALGFATVAHKDQSYGSLPYIVHLVSVARHFQDPLHQVVALLHDSVEDTNTTVEEIREVYGDEVADAVDALTHRKGESYNEYISRVSQNKVAKAVKIADLRENIYYAHHFFPKYLNKARSVYAPALKRLTTEFGHD